ncbi:MAG: PD-(D/E)XK nuclease family protein, partial [Lachnospiraceae bacterium]|nr:PD-(D/E)XK nuclease family protein [Lachnospiraceae bacterium]
FCALAEQSELLRGSVLAFDGFTGFTPVQYRLLEKLMPLVGDLLVTAAVDTVDKPGARRGRSNLFAMGFEMQQKLCEIASSCGVRIADPISVPGRADGSEEGSKEIAFLEKRLFRRGQEVYGESPRAITICETKNPREEMEQIAAEICRLVREEHLRYRDIAVVTGDLASYGIYASEVMQAYEIPYFLDEKRSLLKNPLIEYLRAALETCTDQYAFDSMFRMLKSGMTDLTREEIEHLENYALGTGLRGKKKWRESFVYYYRGQDPEEIPALEELRKRVLALIDPLAQALADRKGTVRDKAAALYTFCAESHAEEKLLAAQERFLAEGRPDLAKEYAQVYPYFCGFLDKLVTVLGDERISMADFRALVEAGFAEARVAIIPPGSDRVLIGDVERSRIGDIKVLLFAGVNEGIVPHVQITTGMLTDSDRELLHQTDSRISLKPTSRQAVYIERFYLYAVLTKPAERLWLSYSRGNGKGETANPSYVIDLVKGLFPQISVRRAGQEEQLLQSGKVQKSADGQAAGNRNYPERKAAGLAMLAAGLSGIPGEPLSDAMKDLFALLREDPEYAERTARLLTAASEHKPVDRIGREAAKAIYGTRLVNSASRLEYFCTCAYAHFLRYGLRLKERPDYVFSGMDFGTIMHRSLELFGQELVGKDVRELAMTEEDREKRLDDCLRKAVAEAGSGSALLASARDQYRIAKMRRLLDAAVDTMTRQLAAGDFRIDRVEQDFYTDGDLRSLQFALPDGTEMVLTGKIDRLDTYTDGDVTYFKIVDFKTGSTEWDPSLVYHGLELQLAVYANAAAEILRREGKHPVPAGMFYQQVKDPVLDFEQGEETDELISRRLHANRGTGVVLKDLPLLQHMDRELTERGKSDVMPVTLLKGGGFRSGSKVLESEDLAVIGSYARLKAGQAAAEMLLGQAEVNPYRYDNNTPCTYCTFRESCSFDPLIPGFRFRDLQKYKMEEAVGLMEEQLAACRMRRTESAQEAKNEGVVETQAAEISGADEEPWIEIID